MAVVVLTWNGREDTLACLRTLEQSTCPGLDVIVVDNGSTDGTREALAATAYRHMYINTGENLGFAGGNNVGLEVALERGADALLLLNNDTLVSPTAVSELVDALFASDDVGACSPAITYVDEPERLWFAGSAFDPRLARAGRNSRYETGQRALPSMPIDIDRTVGAAMLVRREAIAEAGLMAEELFYLYEDVDWSLRIRAAGWSLQLVPTARIAHKVAASQGGDPVTPATAYYGTRNDLAVGRRHGGLTGAARVRREVLCVGVHLAGIRRARPRSWPACVTSTLVGWLDFRRGRMGPRT